jgi:hypothetical protein
MGALDAFGVDAVNHYTPLHYLPFIGRARSLLGKPSLAQRGFSSQHLRSMSSRQDVARGFGEYAFLTLDSKARILQAKLEAGFRHIGIRVPSSVFNGLQFGLCRYNVAMTRFLRRDGKTGFPESASNGRYYGDQQIPIAKTEADQRSMLEAHLQSGTMIEVLVSGDVPLPPATTVVAFSVEDAGIAQDVVSRLNLQWRVFVEQPPGPYNRRSDHVRNVSDFIAQALENANWRGNGLEFDRI